MKKLLFLVAGYFTVVLPLAATNSRLTFVWGVLAGSAALTASSWG